MLEKVLGDPAPGRETVWNRRAGAAVVIVVDALNVHRESEENEGGILVEVGTLPRGQRATATSAR